MRDVFSSYHPTVNFLYFGFALAFSMVFMHPVCLGVSLICSLAYSVYLNRKKAVRFNLVFMLPVLVMTVLLNPLFNHQGATILTYLWDGNPLTLESIVYGLAAAVMLISVMAWFSSYNTVITSDKFVYLFGRAIPAMSLILSMSLRFVPRFRAQIKHISNAQKCVGRDASNGGLLSRARHGLAIMSVMATWALENAIETADSMKSRGYGLKGRTAFSIYRFERRDLAALAYLFLLGGYVITGATLGGLSFYYFPAVTSVGAEPFQLSLYLAYFSLMITPVALNIREDSKWRSLRSRI